MNDGDDPEEAVQDAIAVLLLLQSFEHDLATAAPETRRRLGLAIAAARRTIARVRAFHERRG